jgi:glycosyltransferase involved in cell wall biosynthesis
MRILFVLDRLNVGGAELHAMKLASELAARGHDVATVVLLSGGSSTFPIEGFPNSPERLEGSGILSFRMLRDLRKAVIDTRPDFVFAINQTALVATTLVRSIGAPTARMACIFHTTVIASRLGQLRSKVFKWCTARADALIFVSSRQRKYWQRRGMRSRQVLVIQNGIDASRFALPDPDARAAMRRRFGLSDTDLALILVGRFAPEKNHGWLLRVLASMRDEGLPAVARMRAVFIGEGPLRADIEAQVGALNLSKHVILAGAHRDVAPLLTMGDVGLLVSHSIETFSLAALELMASGLPMIMTDTGGAGEILHDDAAVEDVGGLLIPVDNSSALRSALLELAMDERREPLGMAARKRVLSRFTAKCMVDHYEAFVTSAARAEHV